MYLKEIEIQGFKSFADKTKVVFDQGVTAVVGPNGSGKSNITESLRWALGESSVKSLRGGKMPDVIFAGTESRKPLNYASVVVTLDNHDGFIKDAGQEIRVERHIYRSGDSEYKIDGKKVRLRDIHDLFLDTGLGRDSFSIISQGKVEEIFNSKPEERRSIFEEAAGVLKYKTRRKETESKLQQTQDNLDRLEDIIYELDNQIKPLEKQAENARKFLDLEGQRKAIYLDVLVAQIKENKAELESTEEELAQVQELLMSYYQKREKLEEENQTLKKQRQDLQAEMAKDQGSLMDLTSLISDLERKLALSKLESEQVALNQQEAQARLAALEDKRNSLSKEKSDKESSLALLEGNLVQNNQKLNRLEAELLAFSDDPDQMIELLRERFVALLQEEADVSNQLTRIENELENSRQLSQKQADQLEKLKEQLAIAKEKASQQKEELETAKEQVQKLLADYQAIAKEQEEQKTSYQAQQSQLFDRLDNLKNKQARAQSLENILRNHSNFYAGVKSVLQEKDRLGGIIGAVSEHLTFDMHYQTALEIALGASSQHIIVEDENAATKAIDFLKRNRAGRATFLPLTTIKARTISSQNQDAIAVSPGFLGMADELVTCDTRLEAIFKNLLATTAIFDTVEHAREAARQVRYQVRMVTLDGTELRTGGSYAGGANRQNNSIFIKPELEQLQKEIAEEEASLGSEEVALKTLQDEMARLIESLEAIKSQGEQARIQEQGLFLAYQQTSQQVEELETLWKLQEEEIDRLSEGDWQADKENCQERLAAIASDKQNLEAEIEEIKSNKNAIQERYQNLQEELAQARLLKTELQGQKRYEVADIERLGKELDNLNIEQEEIQRMLQEKVDNLEKVDTDLLNQQAEEAKTQKTNLQQGLIRKQFELDDIEGQLDDIASHLDQARQQNEEWIRKQTRAEAKKEKVSERLRHLQSQLTDQYQISYTEALEKAHELENLNLAEQEVKDLEKAIRSLGPVNIEAIDQYEEVRNRLDFLNSQRDDILSAKNLLLETITEMNDEVKERFKSTFEAIRESFKVTFKQMFGGGQADLILTEGDLLTAGVEISVQPPGKKIQSLNLMSGGEKALSALALLFSIIRVKTIPFVILDEVEAALDEANVKRFGDYLNRFDKDSQFIVVTHRKGTMAAADSIYGVTMQESGVSKIVSVKLKDLEGIEG
ncbi:chromosome condensation and segregation SMC protein [Streptococcus pneumoniae]|uniref:Chromosome partition protein Smc n=1 Tax=Streptococcus pneumoniae TaxID=1313 RepID=A0A4G3V583_STREE|nr:chromosome segregation protein SMC [Streptococcus pneumoniae]CJE15850.1 chromosome condensation and segregation SMC protein [Streptococcus pneumoniae]VFI26465.1 chromosome condensation and segregation SMC protein [Streptococcus pneumoniae]VIT44584.1 chromosome condensation and segregation SMC protein [Streptococcus pneumoniae]VJF53285.1 chromosome condensation and segregation SMC protein [Streptococcus pneumoniae]VJL52806.1 chromosome condensation and segregation SMC protein [Streptococcus 